MDGSLGGVHLLLQSGQIVLPGIEQVGLPTGTECRGPAYFQQVRMVLFLFAEASEESPHQPLVSKGSGQGLVDSLGTQFQGNAAFAEWGTLEVVAPKNRLPARGKEMSRRARERRP